MNLQLFCCLPPNVFFLILRLITNFIQLRSQTIVQTISSSQTGTTSRCFEVVRPFTPLSLSPDQYVGGFAHDNEISLTTRNEIESRGCLGWAAAEAAHLLYYIQYIIQFISLLAFGKNYLKNILAKTVVVFYI